MSLAVSDEGLRPSARDEDLRRAEKHRLLPHCLYEILYQYTACAAVCQPRRAHFLKLFFAWSATSAVCRSGALRRFTAVCQPRRAAALHCRLSTAARSLFKTFFRLVCDICRLSIGRVAALYRRLSTESVAALHCRLSTAARSLFKTFFAWSATSAVCRSGSLRRFTAVCQPRRAAALHCRRQARALRRRETKKTDTPSLFCKKSEGESKIRMVRFSRRPPKSRAL